MKRIAILIVLLFSVSCVKSFPDSNWMDFFILKSLNSKSAVATASQSSSQSFIIMGSPLTTNETGITDTFRIVMNSAPVSTVKLCLHTSDATEATIDIAGDVLGPDVDCIEARMEFTTANWNIAHVATVRGVDDVLSDGSQIYYIITDPSISADANSNGIDPSNISGTNADNDGPPGVTVNPVSGLVLSETGTTSTYDVVLDTVPTAAVKICLSSSDTTEATIVIGGSVLASDADCPVAKLEFTALDWNLPQTVTVKGADDPNSDGVQPFSIINGGTISVDANYSGIKPSDVSGTTADNDGPAGITVSPTFGLVTPEAPSFASFTIVLDTAPAGPVKICLASSTVLEADVVTGGDVIGPDADCATASVQFTITNWFLPKTVNVTGVPDGVNDADQPFSIITTVTPLSDPVYAAINPADPAGTNLNYYSASGYVRTTFGSIFSSISGTGTEVWVADAGDVFVDTALPFTFTFMGQAFNQTSITTKGAIFFPTGFSFSTGDLFTTWTPNYIAGAWWNDMRVCYTTAPFGRVYTQTLGVAPNREFVVEYNKISTWGSCTTYATFQIRLYETSNIIDFIYDTAVYDGVTDFFSTSGLKGDATVSPNFINAPDGSTTVGTFQTFVDFPAPGTVIRFTP